MDNEPNTSCEQIASFRDPGGTLSIIGDHVIRKVNSSGQADLQRFLASSAARRFSVQGKIVSTWPASEALADACRKLLNASQVDAGTETASYLEHERIFFPSFPYEWAPQMLSAAAVLTLELAEALLEEENGLKDATPYNVLFRGPEPVFVDSRTRHGSCIFGPSFYGGHLWACSLEFSPSYRWYDLRRRTRRSSSSAFSKQSAAADCLGTFRRA